LISGSKGAPYEKEVDDVILLIEVMKKTGLPEILDAHLRRHGLHQGMP